MNSTVVTLVLIAMFGSLAATAGLIGFAAGYIWKELMDEQTPRP